MSNFLGDLESSEQLIKDLYINLRKSVNRWANVTKQTPQARMGYVGQHLTSVVTGFPGGKSGARGYDIIISRNPLVYGEIKTCYRVDQLGVCKDCHNVVSSIEKNCSVCNSINIKRNDDSKWLITIKDADDLQKCFEPKFYYFVLFEYVDIKDPSNLDIQASIWQVDSSNEGFKYCLIDYFYNIKGNAPLNIWPYMLKFELFNPKLIYRSIIREDDTIQTKIFPGRDEPCLYRVKDLHLHKQSKNLTTNALQYVLSKLCPEIDVTSLNRKQLIDFIEEERAKGLVDEILFSNLLVKGIYLPLISKYI